MFERTTSQHDTAGLRLDGDEDGNEGGDFVQLFDIAPPNLPPTDVTLSIAGLDENLDTSASDVFVSTLNAIAPDLIDTHTFAFAVGTGDTDNGRFVIVDNELRIKQNQTIDFELQSGYQIRVAVTDSAGQSIEKSLTLNVNNLPEIAEIRVNEGSQMSSQRSMVRSVRWFTTFDGSQRSMVRSVTIEFDQQVDHTALDSAFALTNTDTSTEVTSLVITSANANGRTVVEITFQAGSSVVSRAGLGPLANSLADGHYQLTVDRSKVVSLQERTMSEDVTFGDQANDSFFRLYGDTDGDGDADLQDYASFGLTLFKQTGDAEYDAAMDSDGDGDVDGIDIGNFRRQLMKRLDF